VLRSFGGLYNLEYIERDPSKELATYKLVESTFTSTLVTSAC
jgi:hypothetical protein